MNFLNRGHYSEIKKKKILIFIDNNITKIQ